MRLYFVTLSAALVTILPGCANLDAISSRSIEHREATTKVQEDSLRLKMDQCQTFDFAVSKDVDSVYASAVGRFALRTPEERKKAVYNPGYPMRGDAYVHNAQAGAFYRVSDWANVPGFPTRASWMNLELSKRAPAVTGVKGYVCWEAQPPEERRQAFLSTLRSSL